jgi:hypothetical protein
MVKVQIVFALSFALMAVTGAAAQEVNSYPGSSCQASGSAQDLYYSGVTVANRGNAVRSAVCPIVRANVTDGWTVIQVYVRDRHSTQNITCVAQARHQDGTAAWSQARSSMGEGDQTLFFPAPGGAVPNFGPYVLVCSIPPMEEVNQPSYISSYVVEEL